MDTRHELLAKLDDERAALLREITQLTPEGWSRRSGEEEWTPRQQLLHLLAVEPQYSSAALAAALGSGSSRAGVEQRTPDFETAETWTPDAMVAELNRVREDTLAAIARIADDQFELRSAHGSFGDLSVLQLLRAIYRHDRMHADQVAGRPVTFQPRVQRSE